MNDRQLTLAKLEALVSSHPESLAKLPPDMQRSIQTLIAGKDDAAQPAPVHPLLWRCECGKRISKSRFRCLDCQQIFLMDLGSQIDTQEMLDAVLLRSAAGHEAEFLEQIRPYLKFQPATSLAVSEQSGCAGADSPVVT